MTEDGQDYRKLLQELLLAYGPCGQEDAVREICHRELEPVVDEAWVDPAGNLVGLLRGGDGPPIRVMAHMDELSMLVKRVEPDGTLALTPLGTMYPANFGLGPVAVLGFHKTLCGVLALGSEHTTHESERIWRTKPDQGDKALDWPDVYVFTGLTTREIEQAGVTPGTRVCVDRSKRTLIDVGDGYLGSYFLDDRAAVTALLQCAGDLRGGRGPAGDVYFVFTVNEEIGGLGGTYASRHLPGDLTLALEVGPTEPEYSTTVAGGPIVAYSDAMCIYDKPVADRLMDVADELGLAPQAAVLGAFESDASHSKASGACAQAGLLCLPTMSTHGYEVIANGAIPAMASVLAGFLERPRRDAEVDAQR
ncbi:putative aminopeptidase FrvX [Mycolicibacterium iranicum]|uniref:Putative aminopeptidase FrvX n=1 Tax=Mycolicibacterium iranicum TaxID=912594 RepID=A0A839PXY8_MYCIR|nr:peptidase M42 [Mycolicibacterium iranicum]MBB2988900.1 putative aminopeptidase FrvX [Mycolicibacterium iranicum]